MHSMHTTRLDIMFSDRFDWNLSPNSLSRILLEKKSRGEEILDLTQSNPTQAGLEYAADDILAALSPAEALRYEPDPRGLLKARRAIARYYRDRGAQVDSDDVFLTAGTSSRILKPAPMASRPGSKRSYSKL